MSRIGPIGTLTSSQATILRRLSQIGAAIDGTTERLSTLRRVNRASDDPAAITSISKLESEIGTSERLQVGLTRANNLLTTADSAAEQVATNLQAARDLVLEVAGGGLTSSEIAAKQTVLDNLLKGIDQSSRASFDGRRLLDGSSGFRASGYNSAQITNVDVLDKANSGSTAVTINVTTAATQGERSYTGGALGSATTLSVNGPSGTAAVSLASGATTTEIESAFNAVSYLTGVTATRIDASQVDFKTVAYGTDASFSFEVTEGTFATTGTGTGTDAIATINGRSVTAAGTTFSYQDANLNAVIETAPSATGALTGFTVTGTGLEFQNSASVGNPVRIGLGNLGVTQLGGSAGRLSSLKSGGSQSLTSGNAATSLAILDRSLARVNAHRAQIGGFQKYAIQSSIDLFDVQQKSHAKQLSEIRDTDVAYETAILNRQQLLSQAAQQALLYSNISASSALSVLNGQ